MIRTLRGAWERRSVLVPLLVVAAVAVAGTTNVTAFAEGVGIRTAFAAPILLLAVLAVPAVARDLAVVRRAEIGQVRMRGVRGLRLVLFLAVEPLLVLALGGALGLSLGRAAAHLTGSVLDLHPGPFTADDAWLAAAVVGIGLLAVLLGMVATAREPLARQLGTPVRRPSSSFVVLFGRLLVLCAAGFACFQSVTAEVSPEQESGAGWLLLAGPALVGLAVGMVAVWVVRGVATVLAGSRGDRAFPTYLAVRRLARGTDLADAVGFVVAASVVVAVAASGQHTIGVWTDQTAKLRTGAPLQVEVPDGALAALELSRRVDPEGRWLMAGVLVDQGGPDQYAYLDTERYPRVVGDFLDDTPAGGLADEVAGLAAGRNTTGTPGDSATGAEAVSILHADELEVRVRSSDPTERWYVGITYVNDEDYTEEIQVSRGIPADGRLHKVRLPRCSGGCTVTEIISDPSRRPLVVSRLQAGDVDLLDGGWSVKPGQPLERSSDGMVIPVRKRFVVLRPSGVATPLPVLVAGSGPEDDEVVTSGGNWRGATVVARHDALPLVEASGSVGDLPRALLGASQTGRGSRAVVLARADTPSDVIAELPGDPRDPDALGADLAVEVGADRGSLYLLVGLWSVLLAIPVLASAAGRARRHQRQEAAALRVTGVALADVRRAGHRQWTILAVAGVAATLVGGALAAWLLPDGLRLVAVPPGAIPVPGWVSWPVAYGGAVAVVLLLAAALATSSRREAGSRPAVLREEATR